MTLFLKVLQKIAELFIDQCFKKNS